MALGKRQWGDLTHPLQAPTEISLRLHVKFSYFSQSLVQVDLSGHVWNLAQSTG